MSAIKQLSEYCYKLANEGEQLKGSIVIVPTKQYEELLLEMGKDAVVGFEFLGAKVLPKDDASDFEFIPNELNIMLNDKQQEQFNQQINSEIAKRARAHYEQVQEQVKEALKVKGIVFADNKAFVEFCKTQLQATTQKDITKILYQNEELISFNTTKVFSHDKNN